jgi:hypothetical protein
MLSSIISRVTNTSVKTNSRDVEICSKDGDIDSKVMELQKLAMTMAVMIMSNNISTITMT